MRSTALPMSALVSRIDHFLQILEFAFSNPERMVVGNVDDAEEVRQGCRCSCIVSFLSMQQKPHHMMLSNLCAKVLDASEEKSLEKQELSMVLEQLMSLPFRCSYMHGILSPIHACKHSFLILGFVSAVSGPCVLFFWYYSPIVDS